MIETCFKELGGHGPMLKDATNNLMMMPMMRMRMMMSLIFWFKT